MVNLRSDNEAPVAPEIMAAITNVNNDSAPSYGADAVTAELSQKYSSLFEREVTVFPVITGTAANALALGHVTPSYGAIFCTEQAHVLVDECGAPGFYAGGAIMRTLPGADGKIAVEAFAEALSSYGAHGDHEARPAALTVSQATECGTLYQPDEISALAKIAGQHDMVLHMDGARFGNAVSALGCSPADITWRAGVDILSFGATKNGALAAEAVIIFRPDLGVEFGRQRMRGGHLLSKMRYLSVQLTAYIQDGLWLSLARRANDAARQLANGLSELRLVEICYPVETNALFVRFPEQMIKGLIEDGFLFHRWPGQQGMVRLMCPYTLSQQDIDFFLESAHRHLPGEAFTGT
ncbi:MAG TPA: low specificity L-threonine aldolase [Alphaproteobacteria bacterium]|nr:low specificity L-threonine aldolase [Alphaproteobacteria bacterium]